MSILFISDLHLSGERPEIIASFCDFLGGKARNSQSLYILGDLFDMWIGDDYLPAPIIPIIEALHHLSASGVPIYCQHGNRDFFLQDHFETMSGCQLLTDPALIDLYGVPTLLMHGDTLCTDDLAYQKYREQVHNPEFQKDFLRKPIEERLAIAKQVMQQSNDEKNQKIEQIMDVNQQAVENIMTKWNVNQLIHGHTHRPKTHKLKVNGLPASRIVLGDWYAQTSILVCEKQGCDLQSSPVTFN